MRSAVFHVLGGALLQLLDGALLSLEPVRKCDMWRLRAPGKAAMRVSAENRHRTPTRCVSH